MEENKLTKEKKNLLKQGTKVEFKWYGSDRLYTGRIEVNEFGDLYFVNEHCFENDKLKEEDERLRHYNPLERFYFFTHFEILD